MRNNGKIILSAISAILSLSAATTVIADTNKPAEQATEKCYGISKASVNDCASGANSCAGSAVKDSQSDAFLLTPKGLCEKIVGGSLKSGGNAKKS